MRLLDRILRRPPPDDTSAPQRLPSPDELVLLMRPRGEPEALMLRELLDEHGIRALIKNRDAASAQSGALGPAWAYEMWVRRKDLRRASAALQVGDAAE